MKTKLCLLIFVAAVILLPSLGQAPTQHGVQLSWTPSTSAGVSYNVWRCVGTCSSIFPSSYVLLTTTPVACNTNSAGQCVFEDPTGDLTTSTAYSYAVTAVDSAGNQSGPSNIALVTTPSTFPANPAPPSGCNAKNN